MPDGQRRDRQLLRHNHGDGPRLCRTQRADAPDRRNGRHSANSHVLAHHRRQAVDGRQAHAVAKIETAPRRERRAWIAGGLVSRHGYSGSNLYLKRPLGLLSGMQMRRKSSRTGERPLRVLRDSSERGNYRDRSDERAHADRSAQSRRRRADPPAPISHANTGSDRILMASSRPVAGGLDNARLRFRNDACVLA